MNKRERLTLIDKHQDECGKAWVEALDACCVTPSEANFDRLDLAERWVNRLCILRSQAECQPDE